MFRQLDVLLMVMDKPPYGWCGWFDCSATVIAIETFIQELVTDLHPYSRLKWYSKTSLVWRSMADISHVLPLHIFLKQRCKTYKLNIDEVDH